MQAVIAETIRIATPVPIVPVRMAIEDYNYMGYTIKKVCGSIHIHDTGKCQFIKLFSPIITYFNIPGYSCDK